MDPFERRRPWLLTATLAPDEVRQYVLQFDLRPLQPGEFNDNETVELTVAVQARGFAVEHDQETPEPEGFGRVLLRETNISRFDIHASATTLVTGRFFLPPTEDRERRGGVYLRVFVNATPAISLAMPDVEGDGANPSGLTRQAEVLIGQSQVSAPDFTFFTNVELNPNLGQRIEIGAAGLINQEQFQLRSLGSMPDPAAMVMERAADSAVSTLLEDIFADLRRANQPLNGLNYQCRSTGEIVNTASKIITSVTTALTPILPEDCLDLLATIESSDGTKSVLISYEANHFPWEIVRPSDVDGAIEASHPASGPLVLGRSVAIGRWPQSLPLPSSGLSIGSLFLIAPDAGFLRADPSTTGGLLAIDACACAPNPSATTLQREMAAVRNLVDRAVCPVTIAETNALLEDGITWSDGTGASIPPGRFDLLHFSGHGAHDDTRPEQSSIGIEAASAYHADDFASAAASGFIHGGMVFLNCCESAHLPAWQLDGWAEACVDADVRVFAGCMWIVETDESRKISATLYESLTAAAGPIRVGALLLGTKQNYGTQFLSNHLAYTLYGHPNLELQVPAPGFCSAPHI